jgi:hypothetical protein
MKRIVNYVEEANKLRKLHQECCEAIHTGVQKAIQAGEILVAVKAKLKHGEWIPWIQANLNFDRHTAAQYMRCYDHRERLNVCLGTHLTIKDLAKIEWVWAEEEPTSNKPTPPKRELVSVPGQERPVLLGGRPLPMMNGRVRTDSPKSIDLADVNRKYAQDELAAACRFAQLADISGDELLEMLRALLLEYKLN